jgi:UDP-GlcNAc:undecaprenyl-phosphate GlcNAc-1-phosphate transferase
MSVSHFAAYFLTALVIALATTPAMRAIAFRIGALDRGAGRRIHEGAVPRLGGGGIYLAFVAPVGFYLLRYPAGAGQHQIRGVLLAATLVFVLGLFDDLHGAPIRNKLAIEVAAALVLYGWGLRIEQVSGPFGGHLHLGWLALPATVLWVVVITNALNLVDGLDGLAAGTGILIAGALFALTPRSEVALSMSLCVLAGALFGFLRHNYPPATIFMGDSGSLLVGFLLSAFSLLSSFKAAAVVTLLVPVLVFSHPLLDMVYAVLRRYYRGLPLGSADKEHIHHKLLDMGFSRRAVLGILVGVNVAALLVAAVAARRQLRGDVAILVLMPLAGILGLRLLGYVRYPGAIAGEVRVLGMDRHRRYLLYLIREFRRRIPKLRGEEDLAAAAAALFLESGLAAAELRYENGVGPHVIALGEAPAHGAMRLETPVLEGARTVGSVVLLAPVERGPLGCAPELGAAFAEAVAALASASGSQAAAASSSASASPSASAPARGEGR